MGTQIARSPFCVFAKIHSTLLGEPVNVIEGVMLPFGIALNSNQQLVVSEWGGSKVTVFDKDGEKVQSLQRSVIVLDGLTVDQDDQIYVSCENSLFKFNTEGNLIKVVGQHGTQPGEFSDLCLIRAINDKVYVCDCGNHRVQILNTNLEYMNTFGCYGDGDSQFNRPTDIAQDRAGNLYVTDSRNHRVQVFDSKRQFLDTFCKKGVSSERINHPRGICVGSDQLLYVCEKGNKCVSVFRTNGEFVTSFGQFINSPAGIAIDGDGFFICS